MNEPTLKDVMAAIAALGARLDRLEKWACDSAAKAEQRRIAERDRKRRERWEQYQKNQNAVLGQTVHGQPISKEVEEGKEDIPPTPPIEEKGEGEENLGSQNARARVRARGFVPPTLEEVAAYFTEKGFSIEAEHFYNYNSSRGWNIVKGIKVADWRALAGEWERDRKNKARDKRPPVPPFKDAEKLFTAFWEAYPGKRKGDKEECERTFYGLIDHGADKGLQISNAIQAGLERWKKCDDWVKCDGKFVCAPLVFLHQDKWKYEPPKFKETHGYTRRSISEHANVLSDEADGAF